MKQLKEHRYTNWEQKKLDQEYSKHMDSVARNRKKKPEKEYGVDKERELAKKEQPNKAKYMEEEQLQELSKNTLKDYIRTAIDYRDSRQAAIVDRNIVSNAVPNVRHRHNRYNKIDHDKIVKRTKGINKALNKLEEDQINEKITRKTPLKNVISDGGRENQRGFKKFARKVGMDEPKQTAYYLGQSGKKINPYPKGLRHDAFEYGKKTSNLQELNKSLVKRYLEKAKPDAEKHHQDTAYHFRKHVMGGKFSDHENMEKSKKKRDNRDKRIDTAEKKLAAEELSSINKAVVKTNQTLEKQIQESPRVEQALQKLQLDELDISKLPSSRNVEVAKPDHPMLHNLKLSQKGESLPVDAMQHIFSVITHNNPNPTKLERDAGYNDIKTTEKKPSDIVHHSFSSFTKGKELNELSIDLLQRYWKKAGRDKENSDIAKQSDVSSPNVKKYYAKRSAKRLSGAQLAYNKAKARARVPATYPEYDKMHEAAYMQEASKQKLQTYVAKAVQNYGSTRVKQMDTYKNWHSDDQTDDLSKFSHGAIKRYVGINRAVSKLAGRGAKVKAK